MQEPGPGSDLPAAAVPDPATAAEEGDFGLFRLGQETIAVDIAHLEEVARIDVLRRGIDDGHRVLGMITLRGVLVPVIDPLGRYDGETARPGIAVILSVDDQFAGLAVDEVKGLRRFPLRAIQRLAGAGSGRLATGAISTDDGLIHVIDAPAILRSDATPRATVDPRKTLRADRGLTTPFLTFLAGGVSFAVQADRIVGTVPQRAVEDATGAGGAFRGTISYYGRRLPILASNLAFGIGADLRPERFETVVLRFPGDRLLGLAAERIVRVASSKDDSERPLPEHVSHSVRLMRSTVSFDNVIHFVVDETRMVADPTLLSIAGLSDTDAQPVEMPNVALEDGHGAVTFERERYLLAEAGTRIGIRITDIDAMRNPPQSKDILRTDLYWPGFLGLFVLDGDLVPVVRLAEHLGLQSTPNQAHERVIMSSDADRRVAFLVDSLTGIGTSDWVTQDSSAQAGSLTMASLKAYGRSEIRHIVDLRKTSKDLLDCMIGQQQRELA